MKLSDWKADETLVEVVNGYADGMPPIDRQVSIMGRELLQVCNNDGALAFSGAVQAYVEACAYAAQLKQERDRLQEQLAELRHVHREVCQTVLQRGDERDTAADMQKHTEETLRRVIAERDSLSRRVEALERQVEAMAQ